MMRFELIRCKKYRCENYKDAMMLFSEEIGEKSLEDVVKVIGNQPFIIMDRTREPLQGDALYPFALEDLICKHVGLEGLPAIHMWRHSRALIMGLRDRRLPYAKEAMEQFKREGYAVGVRHSGGAAVPLDDGVVNVTLMMPKMPGDTDFHRDFIRMVYLLEQVLRGLGITFQSGEIPTSYCPGDYDLSVAGRKFCGIAQRRQLKAYAVQAFILVEGNGMARGQIAKAFYEHALGESETAGSGDTIASDVPNVDPNVMISLSEVSGRELKVSDVTHAVTEWIRTNVGIAGEISTDKEWNAYYSHSGALEWEKEAERMAAKLHERYDKSL